MTGSDKERELVNLLAKYGFATMRAPSSGSATARSLPDLIAAGTPLDGGRQRLYAIEAKCQTDATIYVPNEEVAGLLEFADRAGFVAYLAARWKRDQAAGWSEDCTTWFLKKPAECHRTESSYRLTRPASPAEWNGLVFDPAGVDA